MYVHVHMYVIIYESYNILYMYVYYMKLHIIQYVVPHIIYRALKEDSMQQTEERTYLSI